ncbi:MAG: hypothetical protein VX100_08730 [Pseudomonadota bacterium]|uniref:hypothetical protein n=1 Tax=Pseudoalteromonas spongiae TaxID=298657 RepID=UPI00026CA9B2|nr:hypothetical protein [Pseudoalteromonas spongiae]MEC8326168.1 hypothetical protein [Pseudomonadota bacterium]
MFYKQEQSLRNVSLPRNKRNKKFGVNPFRYLLALYMPFFLKSFWTHEIDFPLVNKGGRGNGEVLTISDPLLPIITIPLFLYGIYYLVKVIRTNWKFVNGSEARMGAYMCIPFGVVSFLLAIFEKPNFAIFIFISIGVLGLFAVDFNSEDKVH